jgi:hypothetical protein
MSLIPEGRAPGVVVVTAVIEDGGVASYALHVTVRRGSGGWRVSGVEVG